MGILLALQAPGPEACAKWNAIPATSPPEGLPTGIYDLHEAEVQCQHGEDADATFDRIRTRLFAYDIFPLHLVRHAVCPGPMIEHGSLIVQRVGVGPLRLESAVRVVDVWERDADGEREFRLPLRHPRWASRTWCGVLRCAPRPIRCRPLETGGPIAGRNPHKPRRPTDRAAGSAGNDEGRREAPRRKTKLYLSRGSSRHWWMLACVRMS